MIKRGHIFSKFLFLGLASAAISMSNAALADGATKFVGNITTRGQVRSDFGTYWNQITAENECKWASIQGSGPTSFNWSGCDAAYNWAKENGGHFKFHALIWGSQYPNWLNGLDSAATYQAIENWFDAVAERYPDLEMIDVVNEAIRGNYTQGDYQNQYHSCYTTKPEYNNEGKVQCANSTNKIMQALGGDGGQYTFITNAFKMARARWKNAILIYNDYNTIQWSRNDGVNLIKTIKNNGAPVDAYGLQSHDLQKLGGGANGTGGGGSCYELEKLEDDLDYIWKETQIPMFISEYDISAANDDEQKACYSQQISLFMENEHIAGITIWGYVNGATWSSNTGIINEDGTERAAMTWLKEYLSTHTGANSTGLIGSDPQKPFNATNTPWTIPGKIEAENFDIPGTGPGNKSYSDSDTTNHGESTYRNGTGVDIKDLANGGHAIGWNANNDWLEYTINVSETGDYTLYAAVSGEGGRMVFSLDGNQIGDTINVSKDDAVNDDEEEIDDSVLYGDFYKVKTNVRLESGVHILRMTVAQQWFDLDYFNFVKGLDAEDDAPLNSSTSTNNSSSSTSNNPNSSTSNNQNSSTSNNPNTSTSSNPGNSTSDNPNTSTSSNPSNSTSDNPSSSPSGEGGSESPTSGNEGNTDDPAAIGNNIHMATQGLTDYDIIDIHGVRIGRLSAYSTHQAIETAKYSNTIKSSGIYYIRSRATGKIQSLRIVR